jgi:amidase
MTHDLWRLSAVELAARIARREVSCREAVASCLARLDAVNPRINAVVQPLHDEARQAADAADAALARGEAVGPLHGVPVTIKVNVDQKGCATTNGVVAYRGVIAPEDSPVVANLRRAGAIVVGRTNTPAFSMRWFTDNDAHGRTLNPHDPALTPGGSSGGAAAAVAAGIGPIGHGNDQGGSVRYPAYACGVAGLRPTSGRVPAFNPSAAAERPPVIQLTSVQGPLARSVADLRLALGAMAGADSRDPWWVPLAGDAPGATFPTRVAVCRAVPGYPADPAVIAAVDQAARWLQDAGCTVEEAVPPRFREASELWATLTMADTMALMAPAIYSVGDEAIRRSVDGMAALGAKLDLAGYMRALGTRTALMRAWGQFLERHPLLLLPSSWQRPFPIDADQRGLDAMRAIVDAQSPLLSVALLGLPGLSVPTGLANGAPMGVQLVAGRFREGLLLSAGEAIEARVGAVRPIDPRAARA